MKKVLKKIIDQKTWVKILELIVVLLVLGGIIYLLVPQKDEMNKVVPVKVEEKPKVKIVDLNSTSRPFAVMINNINVARPLQSGLQDAYIIYEIIVEGGITRYMALFLDANTERIGSIRSARHYFLDYAKENDAIYVHHGQSPQAQRDFSALKVDRISVDNTKTGWRDKTLRVASEHTLFSSIEKLKNGVSNYNPKRDKNLLLTYSAKKIDLSKMEGAIPASSVSITYSSSVTSSYVYNNEDQTYYRSINSKEHTDYITGKQYNFKNIITYQVSNSSIGGDQKGRQNINNVGSGTGYYISNGYAAKINWEKTCRECQTKYTYPNGKDIVVNDGNTFIQIQPTGQNLTIA